MKTGPKYYEVPIGSFVWLEMNATCEIDKWEAYDFMKNEWVPGDKFCMMWLNPWPYPDGLGFVEYLKQYTAYLPSDATVFYYTSNEAFGVARLKNPLQHGV